MFITNIHSSFLETERIIGQKEVIDRLLLLDKEDRVPHAMLFVGPQGVGKMAVAYEFAKHLLTKNDERGNSAAMVERLSHPDLIFSFPVIRPRGTNSDHQMESDDFRTEWNEMLNDGLYFDNFTWMQQMGAENQQAIIGVGEANSLIRKLSLKSMQGGY